MNPITTKTDLTPLKEYISSAFPIKLFLAREGRNTWGGEWEYWRNSSWHTTIGRAKDYCEKNRVQGSQWRILEAPGICVLGCKNHMIVGQLSPIPFGAIKTDSSMTLFDLYNEINTNFKTTEVKFFIDNKDHPNQIRLPFLIHQSTPQGGHSLLGWSSQPTKQDISGVIRNSSDILFRVNK